MFAKEKQGQMEIKNQPTGIVNVPFKFINLRTAEKFEMEITTGFVGVAIEDGEYVRPAMGWSIADDPHRVP